MLLTVTCTTQGSSDYVSTDHKALYKGNAYICSVQTLYLWNRKKIKSLWLWKVATCRPTKFGSWGKRAANSRAMVCPKRVEKLLRITSGECSVGSLPRLYGEMEKSYRRFHSARFIKKTLQRFGQKRFPEAALKPVWPPMWFYLPLSPCVGEHCWP